MRKCTSRISRTIRTAPHTAATASGIVRLDPPAAELGAVWFVVTVGLTFDVARAMVGVASPTTVVLTTVMMPAILVCTWQ